MMKKSMLYKEFVSVYEELAGTTKRLEKEQILAKFLKKLGKKGEREWIYLLKGKTFPDYDTGEFGISRQLVIKAISKSFGIENVKVVNMFRKKGDLGEIAEDFAEMKRQRVLFESKLNVGKVFGNLRKLVEMEGKGAVERKMGLIAELLGKATGKEAKYIVRTLLGDLRIGVSDGVLRDSIAVAFFGDDKRDYVGKIERAYDLTNDYAEVFEVAEKGIKEMDKMNIKTGKPVKVMLATVAKDFEDAFRICGKPCAFEYKYDGFRIIVSKKGEEIDLFTRRLENVNKQFPDVIKAVKERINGDSFILDGEIVGYDSKSGKFMPFQHISQRIKRKYDIDKLIEKLPVELVIFDVLFYNGKSVMDESFENRRKLIEKIVKEKDKDVVLSKKIVTDDIREAEKFFKKALADGEEGLMVKNLKAGYKAGRYIGYMSKIKPSIKDLDLVITGAEYGTGKRAGWLTSFIISCRDGNKFVEVGKVSSGLKEKESEEGTSYNEMTKMLKKLIISSSGREVKVKPKIVVSVTYQEIQKSPSYSSGWALRFPRISAYRPDRRAGDINTLKDVERLAEGK